MLSFSQRHRQLIRENLDAAENITSRFYCIPGREWPRYRYDVITRGEALRATQERCALATLEKLSYHRIDSPGDLRHGKDFYRIFLDDERILSALEPDRRSGFRLGDLLLYVLTHELIHIVRFTNEMHAFEAPIRERLQEEKRVHRLTWDILKPLKNERIYDIHSYYSQAPLEHLG